MEARHFFMVEVALRSAVGLRPNPSPDPQQASLRYEGSRGEITFTVISSIAPRPCSAKGRLLRVAPLPSRGEGGLERKPSCRWRAPFQGRLGLRRKALACAFAAPRPADAGESSSPCRAVAPLPAAAARPCSRQGQVSRIAFGAIRSAGKGPLESGPLPATLSPQHVKGALMNAYLPTNHCVSRRTLEAIRSRHPLQLHARLYRPRHYEIGYGNRSDVHPDLVISPCQAEDLLRSDVQYVEAYIRLAVARRVTDRAYQALVSYLFDVGPKSSAARERLSLLHSEGEGAFFCGLEGEAQASRFGEDVGRSARFFEVNLAG